MGGFKDKNSGGLLKGRNGLPRRPEMKSLVMGLILGPVSISGLELCPLTLDGVLMTP